MGSDLSPQLLVPGASHRAIEHAPSTLRSVLGDREAVVLDVRRFDIHGSGFVDVTVGFSDRSTSSARLGIESVPGDLEPGARVVVTLAMNMIVAVNRANDQED
jgi:hypothetical protein